MGKVVEITSGNIDSVLSSNDVVLIDFWAPWCGPCKMQAPILEKLAEDGTIKATIAKLNTDDNATIAQKFGISSIPTIIVFKNGSEVHRFVGVQPEGSLKAKLSSL